MDGGGVCPLQRLAPNTVAGKRQAEGYQESKNGLLHGKSQ